MVRPRPHVIFGGLLVGWLLLRRGQRYEANIAFWSAGSSLVALVRLGNTKHTVCGSEIRYPVHSTEHIVLDPAESRADGERSNSAN
jgi:hypothetical protein